jgi:GNAT superfamily N-acetyltransferase
VTLRHIRPDESARDEDWAAIDRLKATVWGRDAGEQTRALAAEHAADPTAMSVWLAQSPEGEVVSAAWVRFHAGTDFASLWGGSTLPQWRGRGIYTALVSRRAEEAAARGARYLQVDASPQSRPILERLGLHLVTSTTPWMWRP